MISIVLATYNGMRYLPQQLESLAAQTLKADEVIISDDCSTDETVGLCLDFIEKNSLSGWKVMANTENVGYCRNFYRGLEAAQGDYIFFCDQDDIWDAEKIAVTVAEMQKDPLISVLSTRYRLINAEGRQDSSLTVPHFTAKHDGTLERVTVESLIGHSYIRGCSLCMKKELKALIKPIELKDLLGHDWQIAMLAALDGGAAILNTQLMSYRCHDSNASFSEKPVRRLEKRIAGLRQSVEGHEYIRSLCRNEEQKTSMEKFIRFEKRRLAFLKDKNAFKFVRLLFDIKQYSRYYAGGGVKVWLGDFVYAYKK